MHANFLNLAGGMAGIDLHVYQYGPVPPLMLVNIHFTAGLHFIGTPWRVGWNVHCSHVPVLQYGFFMEPVAHVPVPAPPGPLEPEILMWTNILGTSQPVLCVESVKAQGIPVLVESNGGTGQNANCGIFPFTETNLDFNLHNVGTEAEQSDIDRASKTMMVQRVYNSLAALTAGIPGGGGKGVPEKGQPGYMLFGDGLATSVGIGIAAVQNSMDALQRAFQGNPETAEEPAKYAPKLDDLTSWILGNAPG